MEKGKPSGTAIWTALNRASHLFRDGEPKIFRDDFALPFCNLRNEAELNAALTPILTELGEKSTPEFIESFFPSNRGFMVMRHRYTEDELAKALERGVSQYVILGAGLDSFAYRRRDLAEKLRVFEVDYPATQQWKRARLRELNINLPQNLTFVPVDFEKQMLTDELSSHGYRKDVLSFFSWLGVTCYLTEKAVFQTLREIVSMWPGSIVVFDYALPNFLLSEGDRQLWKIGKANPGEPLVRQFEPNSLAKRLKEIGFSTTLDFGPEQAKERYFNGRTDDLSPSVLDGVFASAMRLFHIMKARV